jgi:hypothetical protein
MELKKMHLVWILSVVYFLEPQLELTKGPLWYTFFFFLVLELELRALPRATPPALLFFFFLWRIFQDKILQTICPGLALNCDPPDLCLLSS